MIELDFPQITFLFLARRQDLFRILPDEAGGVVFENRSAADQSMIPKSGNRFSEKIMLRKKQSVSIGSREMAVRVELSKGPNELG